MTHSCCSTGVEVSFTLRQQRAPPHRNQLGCSPQPLSPLTGLQDASLGTAPPSVTQCNYIKGFLAYVLVCEPAIQTG